VLRIILLVVIINLINLVKEPFFTLELGHFAHGEFNLHAIIVLIGGVFILKTAIKEIWHMMTLHESHDGEPKERKTITAGKAIQLIVIMNVIFSVDSILSAIVISQTIWVLATAIMIGGLVMVWLADQVSAFLQKNRMYEVLGLFILLIVGVMLLSEGGHIAHLTFFGNRVEAMSKTTFYFVVTMLILVDLVQTRYQKKLMAEHKALVVDAHKQRRVADEANAAG